MLTNERKKSLTKTLELSISKFEEVYGLLLENVEGTDELSSDECGFGSFREASEIHMQCLDELKKLKTWDDK